MPENAEALMRSRFSAFHQNELAYLKETWHPDFLPLDLKLDPQVKWLGLEVIKTVQEELTASVEFEARLLLQQRVEAMREFSSFVFERGRWWYTTGQSKQGSFAPWKPGRNENCPCGSGLKFKRCCAEK
jgi:SEC-C motif-containing protein